MENDRPANGQEIRVGVLIIGSLLWDPEPHRHDWRRARLNMDPAHRHPVRAPIRYGRRSTKRGCSYTMVFSRGLTTEQFGRAVVVPCTRTAGDAAEIVDEAVRLWTAETPNGSNPNKRVSAAWGCVALVEHPERPLSDDVRRAWKEKVANEGCAYRQLDSAVDEEPAVDRQSGLLNIPWPTPVDGSDLPCDVLLATATNPTIIGGHYPTPEQIAEAWSTPGGKPHVYYFNNNRRDGIATFQDEEIELLLRAL